MDSVLGALVGDGVHAAPLAIREDTCAELPRLCTGQVLMAGVATTLTYFCPEPTQLEAPSTVHITVTKTTTVTPPDVESTQGPVLTPSVYVPD